MSGINQLLNQAQMRAARLMTQWAPQSRIGIVSSYDPDEHSVKVMLQPENKESNWIPIGVQHVGNNFGVMFAPEIGDQLEIGFHQNDPSVARVISRFHSDQQRPPRLEAGEMMLKHKSGTTFFIDKDGNVRMESKGNMRIKVDGNMQINTGGDLHLNGGDDNNAPVPPVGGGEGAPTS